MFLPGYCNGPSVSVTAPEGVVISDGAITGNYDTATSFPLTLTAIGGAEITGVTIDDVAATITEGVVNVPYAAAKMVVSGTAVTVHGTETISDEYTIDVDHEPIRLTLPAIAAYTNAVVNQYDHTINGSVPRGTVSLLISRNGTRATWGQRSRYSYRVKFGEGDWSNYHEISYNEGGSAIGAPAGVALSMQVKYEYGETAETSTVYTYDVSRSDTPDTDITISSVTEGLTIDNENRTITGTFAATDEITLTAAYPEEIAQGNVYAFFCDKWLFTPTSATKTADVMSAASICVPAVKITADDPFIFGVDYTVNITLTE